MGSGPVSAESTGMPSLGSRPSSRLRRWEQFPQTSTASDADGPRERPTGSGCSRPSSICQRRSEPRLATGRLPQSRRPAQFPAVVLGSIAAERLGVSWSGRERRRLARRSVVQRPVGVLAPVELAPSVDRAALIGYPIADDALRHRRVSRSDDHLRARRSRDDRGGLRRPTRDDQPRRRPRKSRSVDPSDALEARAAVNDALTALLVGLGAVALARGRRWNRQCDGHLGARAATGDRICVGHSALREAAHLGAVPQPSR